MIITMPKILIDKLGNDGADALAHVLNEAESVIKSDLATKGDLLLTKADLKAEIESFKADLIKWMFIFWVGQVGVILGILFVFFKR